ncbi:cation ABC transporter substrate-binding protein [candidate division KSB3 bacterium]|uniref:Cation ABC transporter substrate-binding protein n=1 Tax=candidate division KSB3 bacterium TaxID=2044937 RepID=A0A2G6K8G3_9BACT|nr:MAG: cation ABC transporter substrate-binding protein [candidate division KSB3 bacterium]
MKKQRSILMLFVVMFTAILFSPAKASEPLRVAVSIPPQVYFVEQIGGDLVDVLCMLPEGATPHTYEPTAQQMKQLSQADLYVRIQVDFENAWWEKMMSANPDMQVVDSTEGVEFLEGHVHEEAGGKHEHEDEKHRVEESDHHEHHGRNPHIWLSPRAVKMQVEDICQGLVSVDPEHKDSYTTHKESFLNTLNSLDAEIQNKLAHLKTRTFMIFHPAWSYFARDYGLEEISIEIEGKEPSAKEMAELMKIAKEGQVSVIFVQPQSSRRSADTIAKQIGARVEMLDPLAANWFENMRHVSDIFAETLSR